MAKLEDYKKGFINPIIKQVFNDFLADVLDLEKFSVANIGKKGFLDLVFDPEKINQILSNNFYIKLNGLRLANLEVSFKILSKEAKLSLEGLELDLFVNEDLFKSEKPLTDYMKNTIKKVLEEKITEEGEKRMNLIKSLSLTLEIKGIKLNIRPTRASIVSEQIELNIESLKVIKAQDKKFRKMKVIEEITFSLEFGLCGFGIDVLSPIGDDSGVEPSFKRQSLLNIDNEIVLNYEVHWKGDDISVKSETDIKKVVLGVNLNSIKTLDLVYERLTLFSYTNVLNGDVEKNVKYMSENLSVIGVFKDLVNRLGSSKEETAPATKSKLKFDFDIRLNLESLYLTLYDDFDNKAYIFEPDSKTDEDGFLQLTEIENTQVLFKNLALIKMVDDFKIMIERITAKTFFSNKTESKEDEHVPEKQRNSVLFDVHIENTENRDKEEYSVQKRNSSIEDIMNGNSLILIINNELTKVYCKKIKINLMEMLKFSEYLLKQINKMLTGKDSVVSVEFSNEEKEIEMNRYFSNYLEIVTRDKVTVLKEAIEKLEQKKEYLLELPFKLIMCIDSIRLKVKEESEIDVLKLSQCSFNNTDSHIDAKKRFLKINQILMLNLLNIMNLRIRKKEQDKITQINTWDLQVDKIIQVDISNHILNFVTIFLLFNNEIQQKLKRIIAELSSASASFNKIPNTYSPNEEKIVVDKLVWSLIYKLKPEISLFNACLIHIHNVFVSFYDESKDAIDFIKKVLVLETKIRVNEPDKGLKLLEVRSNDLTFEFNFDTGLKNFTFTNFKIAFFEFIKGNTPFNLFSALFESSFGLNDGVKWIYKLSNMEMRIVHVGPVFKALIDYLLENSLKTFLVTDTVHVDQEEKENEKESFKYELNINAMSFKLVNSFYSINLGIDKLKYEEKHLVVESIELTGDKKAISNGRVIYIKKAEIANGRNTKLKGIIAIIEIKSVKKLFDLHNDLMTSITYFTEKRNQLISPDLINAEEQIKEEKHELVIPEDAEQYKEFFKDIFVNFNKKFNSRKMESAYHFLKAFKMFVKESQLDQNLANTVMIEQIRMTFVDEISNHQYRLRSENIFLAFSQRLSIYLVDYIEVSIKTNRSITDLLTNKKNRFALKLLNINTNNDKKSFYLKLDDLEFKGDSKMWDVVDNRLKIFLKDFNIDSESQDKEGYKTKLDQSYLDRCNLYIDLFSEDIVLNIKSVSTDELNQKNPDLGKFIDLFVNKLINEMKEQAKYISVTNSLKLAGFIFWRLLVFIFFKKNFLSISKTSFSLIKSKIKKRIWG